MTQNPMLLFFMFIVCLFIFGFLVNLFYPARPKRAVLASTPIDSFPTQVKDVRDAIDRAKDQRGCTYAEELAKSVVRNNPDAIGLADDMELWLEELKQKRASFAEPGLHLNKRRTP